MYGTVDQWGGELAKKSHKIKQKDWNKKVKPCSRLDRTLVYVRDNVFKSIKDNNNSVMHSNISPMITIEDTVSKHDLASIGQGSMDSIMGRTVRTNENF